MVAVYTVILMTLLCGFVSLGVDLGRVQLVKTQMLRSVDAAARAAVVQLANGVTATQNAAVTWGGYNKADESAVVIDGINDVDFGTWDTTARTFTVLTGGARSTANAVRVWGRRTAARGTAVKLTFGAVVGRSTCDANVSAIAYTPPVPNVGLIGMSSVTVSNTVRADSYDASVGAYAAGTSTTYGSLASNGGISLNGGTINVLTNVYMKAGQSLSTSGTVSYGTRQTLSASIVWPQPSAGSYATTNDNYKLGIPASGYSFTWSAGNGAVSIAGGNYYIDNFTMTGGTVTFTGPTTIYVNGTWSVTGGTIYTYNNLPTNLTIKIVTASSVTLGSTNAYCDIQAPTSPASVSAGTNVYGRLVGSTLGITGTSNVHYDTSLPTVSGVTIPPAGNSTALIQTVR